jgi:predicted permease
MKFFSSRKNRQREAELDAELQSHLDESVRERADRGQPHRDANFAARVEFGNVGLVRETTRDNWGGRSLEILGRDIRFGLRTLRKSPGFAATIIATLALGIGANVAIFSVLYAVLLKPLPYQDPSRLVTIEEREHGEPAGAGSVSYPDFADIAAHNSSFTSIGVYSDASGTITGAGLPTKVHGSEISAGLFSTLGVTPALGTNIFPEPHVGPSPEGVYDIILNYSLWRSSFGSDPAIVGKQIQLDLKPYTVIGVMPAGFEFPLTADRAMFWISIAQDMTKTGKDDTSVEERGVHQYDAVGRLRPDVTLRQARNELATIASQLQKQYPETNSYQAIIPISFLDHVLGDAKTVLIVLLSAVTCLLLLACANVANLLLARSTTRYREMAIRSALGAGRGRIIRQLITESAIFSLAGGALGILLAWIGTNALLRWAPRDIPRIAQTDLNGWVLGFALAISLLTGLIFGLAPALHAARADVGETLKEAGRTAAPSARSNRTRAMLMSLQVAIAVILLVGAGLLLRSLGSLTRVDLGFEPEHVMTASVELPDSTYHLAQRIAFFQQLRERLSGLPGVIAASAATPLPFSGDDIYVTFDIEGRAIPKKDRPVAEASIVQPDFFRAVGIPVVRGRAFTDADTAASTPVIVVNEILAERMFPGEDAIGKRIHPTLSVHGGTAPMREIIGVVRDIHFVGLRDTPRMQYYLPHSQLPTDSLSLVVRATGDPRPLAAAIRDQVLDIDPQLAVSAVKPMNDLVDDALAQPRLNTFLVTAFAAAALALAGIGLFGVLAYSVAQRTHEIGIRMALGAKSSDVQRLVLGNALRMLLWGGSIGLAAAFALTRLMKTLLFGVTATDAATFAGVALVLAVVALIAGAIPARRAARIDPLQALRYE